MFPLTVLLRNVESPVPSEWTEEGVVLRKRNRVALWLECHFQQYAWLAAKLSPHEGYTIFRAPRVAVSSSDAVSDGLPEDRSSANSSGTPTENP